MRVVALSRDIYNHIFTPDAAITHFPRNVGFIMDGNRTPIKAQAAVGEKRLIQVLSRNPDLAGYRILVKETYYEVVTPSGFRYEIDLGFPGGLGYIAGYERMRQVVDLCLKYKIQAASFWGLSTDNIEKRPEEELRVIYQIIEQETMRLAQEAHKKGIKIELIGNREKLSPLSSSGVPGTVLDVLDNAVNLTRANAQMVAAMVLAYGGRDELYRAHTESFLDTIKRPDFPHGATEDVVRAYLERIGVAEQFAQHVESQRKLGDMDLLIRTGSGNARTVRTSGYFPFEDYPEIYQFRGSWLEFDEKEFRRALIAYSQADRKFGGESVKNKK